MRLPTSIGIALLILFCRATFAQTAENSSLPTVITNDNRTPAGTLKGGVLELRLALREGVWYPEQEGGDHRDVYGFSEEGEAPQCSGPLIRVPEGTQIHVGVRNTLPLAAKNLRGCLIQAFFWLGWGSSKLHSRAKVDRHRYKSIHLRLSVRTTSIHPNHEWVGGL